MALLNKDQINKADDRRWEDVDVPEWGGQVRILGLSGTERDAYQASMVRMGSQGNVQGVVLTDASAKLLAKCIVGEDFERLYSDKDVRELGAKNGEVLQRLHKVAQRLSGLGKQALEEKAGNSEADPSGASTSD